MQLMKAAAVFLDRDGTINEEVGYLNNLEQLILLPQAPEAIGLLNKCGMKCIVVTNQSGVARGFFTEDFVSQVHRQMQAMLAQRHAYLDALYYCPHHPEGRGAYRQLCKCRKPQPGMLLQAAQDMTIDLGRSYLIGDTCKDMEAALRAGVKGVLVRTGYGREEENTCSGVNSFPVVDDIYTAVTWIMQDSRE